MHSKFKKRIIWLSSIAAILLVLHIILPFVLVRYVNKTLQQIPGYTGHVEWVHVNLFRGAYQIHSIEILKEESNIITPFFKSDKIDLSVEWKALFHGAIVGEVILINPQLTFIGSKDSDDEGMNGKGTDWTEPIKNLIPLRINRFEISNGNIHYKDPYSDPQVDIYLTEMDALATNLSNVTDEQKELPSFISIHSTSLGNGQLSVKGGINIIKSSPDWDLDLTYEHVDLTTFNNFLLAYASADLKKGSLDLYAEITGKDGQLTGYIKPILTDIQFIDWQKDKKRPLQLFWESIIGTVSEVFENQKKDQLATKIPFDGTYEDISPNIWKTFGGVFKNAFIKALQKQTDNSVNLEMLEDKKKASSD